MCEKCTDGIMCIKAKCTHKMIMLLNIFAVILIWSCIILRIASYDKNRKAGDVNAKESIIIIFMTSFQIFLNGKIILDAKRNSHDGSGAFCQ